MGRLFAWLHFFLRLINRWEYEVENFLDMVDPACFKLQLGNS
jgi:hypothetical protein